ncbi:hypothetical protein BKA67DRAFT_547939 [Truncatella angustata]|uniref:Protein HGH1 homolog n=1 Tax=Truncatella angustata TaxID=152316 RepID=A0A9P9A3F5_9PEZI|nr:uncharacterized protein BKA67DRAFT_547939 [Truncatella angustata]KAH6660407.1 hypothetical protein BKA67DRAFT_547939 [Truncatella angustata]KAH8202568.1 hypothetical protein TruAng_003279 [Truncatella angustata]
MPTELEELVGFIANPNPQIRLLATEHLLPYSTADPSIFKVDNLQPVKNLKLLVKDHPKIAEHVITILVNLSADRQVLESLAADDKFLDTVLGFIISPSEPNANLLSMLLANLAKWDGFKSILDKRQPAPKELGSDDRVLNQLLDLFVKGAEGTYNKAADFDHLSYLFADLTKHDAIRHHFLQKQDYDEVIPITKLIVFTEHKSDVRRKGVASTIKNVAFDIPSHPAFMSDDDINMLPYIILPIIGSEEYDLEESMAMLPELQLLPPDKQRDSDPNIIQTHVETLLLLCTTRSGRDRLREINVYPIVRETHSKVNDADVRDACERLVNFLKGDEDDTNDNARVEELGREAAKDTLEANDDDDNDDDEIVEV